MATKITAATAMQGAQTVTLFELCSPFARYAIGMDSTAETLGAQILPGSQTGAFVTLSILDNTSTKNHKIL